MRCVKLCEARNIAHKAHTNGPVCLRRLACAVLSMTRYIEHCIGPQGPSASGIRPPAPCASQQAHGYRGPEGCCACGSQGAPGRTHFAEHCSTRRGARCTSTSRRERRCASSRALHALAASAAGVTETASAKWGRPSGVGEVGSAKWGRPSVGLYKPDSRTDTDL